jgi:hypothetical protein
LECLKRVALRRLGMTYCSRSSPEHEHALAIEKAGVVCALELAKSRKTSIAVW